MTIKEGWHRGYSYEFMSNSLLMSWTPYPHYKQFEPKLRWSSMPATGFSATLHNRNASNPMMIALDGEHVNTHKIKIETNEIIVFYNQIIGLLL